MLSYRGAHLWDLPYKSGKDDLQTCEKNWGSKRHGLLCVLLLLRQGCGSEPYWYEISLIAVIWFEPNIVFLDIRVTNNELNFNFTNSLSVSDSDESTGGAVRVSDYIEGAKKGRCVLVTECRCICLILWCQYLTSVIYYHFKTWVSHLFWETNPYIKQGCLNWSRVTKNLYIVQIKYNFK